MSWNILIAAAVMVASMFCQATMAQMGLLPGTHKVQIDLEDANHHALDHGVVTFAVPEKSAAK